MVCAMTVMVSAPVAKADDGHSSIFIRFGDKITKNNPQADGISQKNGNNTVIRAHSSASIFRSDDERIIGQGIISNEY